MKKTALVLGAGLALSGCAESWTDQRLERLTDRGAALGEATANQILYSLDGADITPENIDQVYFMVGGTPIKMVELCRTRVEDVVGETEHEMTRATFEFKMEEENFPIVGTLVSNTGTVDAENYNVAAFDFGVKDIPVVGAVSESRWPDAPKFLTEDEFNAFVADIFGPNPNFNCIQSTS